MERKLKSVLKKVVPPSVIPTLLKIYKFRRLRKAKKAFCEAPEKPVWLGEDELESLYQQYPYPSEQAYDPRSLEKLGRERARRILNLIPSKKEKISKFLELGCGSGMVSCALQRMGKKTTAIDISSEQFDKRAEIEGVTLLEQDAADIRLEDGSFDAVFSYASFEHFADPRSVLLEVIRIVRTGGYIYLAFGPLYMSPMGLHQHKEIPIPYCHFLFPKKVIQEFIRARGLNPLGFEGALNCWSLEEYRELFSECSRRLKTIKYYEIPDVFHLDLIMKYPSCFKSKTRYFENLIIGYIEALFMKIG